MQQTHIYGHFSYDKAAAFFNVFKSYHFTTNNYIDYNPICACFHILVKLSRNAKT